MAEGARAILLRNSMSHFCIGARFNPVVSENSAGPGIGCLHRLSTGRGLGVSGRWVQRRRPGWRRRERARRQPLTERELVARSRADLEHEVIQRPSNTTLSRNRRGP